MRAAATIRTEDRLLEQMTGVLNQMQGIDRSLYFYALHVFENPLVRDSFIPFKCERRLLQPQSQGESIAPSSFFFQRSKNKLILALHKYLFFYRTLHMYLMSVFTIMFLNLDLYHS